MIGYVTVGVSDLERAKTFYDTVLAELGAKRTWSNERMAGWGVGQGSPMLMATMPHDGKAATHGNGTMVALAASSKELVEKIYATALAAGGKDEGAPGLRSDNFYGAYFRDPDDNKIAAFYMVKK